MNFRFLKKSILLLFIPLFIGCCDECEEELKAKGVEIKNLEGKILEKEVALEQCNKIASKQYGIVTLDPFKPKQELIKMKPEEKKMYKRSHFKTSSIDYNSFKTDDNEIYLKFPVHNPKDKKIEIVDVLNVSSEKLNAIVVLLNGLDGMKTLEIDADHFIKTTIKIDKVEGLSKSMMASHKNLKVYIFHDDAFYSDELINDFKACVKNDGNEYIENVCESFSPPKSKIDVTRPREQGGDIITGG